VKLKEECCTDNECFENLSKKNSQKRTTATVGKTDVENCWAVITSMQLSMQTQWTTWLTPLRPP